MIRLLLADDQAMVRTGLRMILDAQPDLVVVGEAGDGRDAVEEARRLHPDTVLMDIRMPGMDGVEATRRLAGPGVEDPLRVIVLTTFDLEEYVVEALANATAVNDLLPPWMAVLVLLAYVVVLGWFAALTISRREVALAA